MTRECKPVCAGCLLDKASSMHCDVLGCLVQFGYMLAVVASIDALVVF
jgi:hypothetical protein